MARWEELCLRTHLAIICCCSVILNGLSNRLRLQLRSQEKEQQQQETHWKVGGGDFRWQRVHMVLFLLLPLLKAFESCFFFCTSGAIVLPAPLSSPSHKSETMRLPHVSASPRRRKATDAVDNEAAADEEVSAASDKEDAADTELTTDPPPSSPSPPSLP